jgi:hypothetical protein
MEVAIHLPDDVAAAMPWKDVSRHVVEQIALEGYREGWLSEEQVRRLLGYETRLDVHGFLKAHGAYLREFIPIKPLAAMGSSAPGNCAGHSRVPSPDRGPLASTGGSGPSRCGSA